MSEAGSKEQPPMPGLFRPEIAGGEASAALKRVARNEGIKAYVQRERSPSTTPSSGRRCASSAARALASASGRRNA